MLNLLSAEFFKLRKSKSFYIITMIVAGLAAMIAGLNKFIEISAEGEPHAEMLLEAIPTSGGEMLAAAISQMSMSNLVLCLAIFVAILISGEFDSGCVRNPLSVGFSRAQYYLSKFIVLLIATLVFIIVTVAMSTLVTTAFYGWGETPDLGLVASTFATSYVMLVGQVALFAFVAVAVRKLGATIGILIGYYLLDSIFSATYMFFDLSDAMQSILNIFPSVAAGSITEIAMGMAENSGLWTILGVSLVVAVLFSTLAIWNLNKRDV